MNYSLLADALTYYQSRGYVYIQDAPWIVGKDAYYATKPVGPHDINITDPTDRAKTKFAVASGEQSFLQMMLDDQPIKRAVCITPCYRAERHDDWHKPMFMKVELINAHDTDDAHLIHMIHDAASFFERYLPSVRLRNIGGAYDLVEKGTRIELGSYGVRERQIGDRRLRWIYGTGCAEPRLSTVMERCSKAVGK